MTPSRYVTWGETGAEVQCALWREKLEAAAGNITRAGAEMGFAKSYAMRLTKIHGLNEYARELRVQATGRDKGRPV